jgi:hypothetical protein
MDFRVLQAFAAGLGLLRCIGSPSVKELRHAHNTIQGS